MRRPAPKSTVERVGIGFVNPVGFGTCGGVENPVEMVGLGEAVVVETVAGWETDLAEDLHVIAGAYTVGIVLVLVLVLGIAEAVDGARVAVEMAFEGNAVILAKILAALGIARVVPLEIVGSVGHHGVVANLIVVTAGV